MKKAVLKICIVAVAMFSAISCEDLVDVSYEFYLEHEFTVNSNDAAFDEDYNVDASSESKYINDYKDKIKEIEILSVTYTVTHFVGPDDQKINNATLSVTNGAGVGVEEIATVSNELLIGLTTTEKSLTAKQAGIDRFAELIKTTPHTAILTLEGDANKAPLDFKVLFKFKVRMTASPLN